MQPDAILAGTAVEAMFTVRAQDGLPLAGALIQFGVKPSAGSGSSTFL